MESMDFSVLGLTANEAKAYETLLQLGKTTAAQISKVSGVPYGRIYVILASLESKGFVNIVPERTKKYAPAPPEKLEETIANKKKSLEETEAKLKEYKSLYASHGKEVVQLVQGRHNFYKLLREMKKPERYEYNIKYAFDMNPEFMRDAEAFIKKKGDYRVLGRYDTLTKENIKDWLKISKNIRVLKNNGVALSILDDKEILIALIKSNTILLIRDEPFVEVMRQLFTSAYEQAEEVHLKK